MTGHEGRAELRWERPLRRCLFIVECTSDPAAATGWKYVGTTTRQKYTVNGLPSGEKCWLRVRAQNGHGHSPWSQAVAVRAG